VHARSFKGDSGASVTGSSPGGSAVAITTSCVRVVAWVAALAQSATATAGCPPPPCVASRCATELSP
jgi:hypothetical protein